jgi:hypothetical protein
MTVEESIHTEIGARLMRFREWQGLYNKQEFAKSHGFSVPAYTAWELGNRRIPIECAALLEERYGLTLDFIYLGRVKTLPHSLAIALSLSPKDS